MGSTASSLLERKKERRKKKKKARRSPPQPAADLPGERKAFYSELTHTLHWWVGPLLTGVLVQVHRRHRTLTGNRSTHIITTSPGSHKAPPSSAHTSIPSSILPSISPPISMRAPSPQRYSPVYSATTATSTYPYPYNTLPYYPSPLSAAEKRRKLEQDFENGFPDESFQSSSLDFTQLSTYPTMPVQRHMPINLHINLHRASEPASPITITTPISSHSTPASSPSRVAIMSADHSPQDFQLYDDGFSISADQKPRINRRYEPATPNTRFNNGYNMVAPQSESSVARPGLQAYYPEQPQQFLQTPPHQYGTQSLTMNRALQHSDDDEPPALSPHHQFSTSSRLSDMDLHSPTTPIASPESAHGERYSAPAVRMEAYDHDFVDLWMEQYLLSKSSEVHTPIPKLGARTISDAMQDELYNPGVAPGTSHNHQQSSVCSAPSKFPTLYQQAQKQHVLGTTPVLPRDRSPFRANSPFHPARGAQFTVPESPSRSSALLAVGFPTACAQREHETAAEIERTALQRQMQEEYNSLGVAPKTISPKDTYPEYHEPSQEGIKGSLFAQEDEYSQNGSVHSGSYKSSVQDDDEDAQSYGLKREESFGSMATSRRDSDASIMSYPGPMFSPNSNQQFAPLGFHYGYSEMGSRQSEETSEPTLQQSVEDDGDYDYQPASSPISKPSESKANRGGYTCTVAGCTQRFPTTNKMAKHRREAHRQTTPGSRGDGVARSHHPGPHKCIRINPTTNKPCNTIFSRPYDLTRHEDTIHNTHREKVRCEICNDEKTFSRQDALTRHKKVIFPFLSMMTILLIF